MYTMDFNCSGRCSSGSKVFRQKVRSALLMLCFVMWILRWTEAAYSYCPNRQIEIDRRTSISFSFPRNGTRIGGGTETERNEFPWQAYIKVSFWTNETAICGGAYIGNNWVLSAAHCFYGATNIKVYLGAYNTDTVDTDNNAQVFQVAPSAIIKYPEWFFGEIENDISIIKLPRNPILNGIIDFVNVKNIPNGTYKGFVSPVRLPFADDSNLVGENITLTGWGNYSTAAGVTSPTLRKATSTVISSADIGSECQIMTGLSFTGEKIICADGSQGTRSCYGDDGGPMNHFRSDEGKNWFVIGVAGVGENTNDCLTSRLPNVYARVQYYLGWIYENTDLVPESHRTTTTVEQTEATTTSTTVETTQSSTTSSTASSTTVASTTEASMTNSSIEISTEGTTTTTANVFSCSGQPNGYYVNPLEPCSEIFYQCFNGEITEYTCSPGMVFNVNICACDISINVAVCNSKIK